MKTFATISNGDTIDASDPNDIQDEVNAVENALLNGIAHIVKPTTTATYDLGTSSKVWGVLYATSLNVSGFATHSVSAGGTGDNGILIRNSTAGTGNSASFGLTNDASASVQANLILTSSTYTPATYFLASGLALANTLAGGISIAATHGSGTVRVYAAGTTEVARFDLTSSLQIGGTAARAGTAGTKRIDIFDGTAPTSTLANGTSLYSTSGEGYWMDAAGNATLQTPHDPITNEWIFKSTHTPTGKVLRINVERMLRFLNNRFELDAVHES
ncbi:MAG: hypothetical protein NUW01_12235 [Gemmatimonadaceae bacterium]|nr:hypothetical protein [Gemmatimonadaceae bacterium]